MRRRFALLVAAALASTLVTAVPAAADGHEGGTYLALGDSVPAGTQEPAPFTDNTFANHLYKGLRDDYGFDKLVNLACPGDDTAEMIDGVGGPFSRGIAGIPQGSACFGDTAFLPPGGDLDNLALPRRSQLDAAVAYLTSPDGADVRLVTITLGANDFLACFPDFTDECVGYVLGLQVPSSLGATIATLQAVTDAPIVGMNYYSPNVAFALTPSFDMDELLTRHAGANGVLEAVYGAFNVPVADVASAFKTFKTRGQIPQNVRAVCLYTRMCEKSGSGYVLSDWNPGEPGPQPDIHPSNKGHRKIASTFADLIDGMGLLG